MSKSPRAASSSDSGEDGSVDGFSSRDRFGKSAVSATSLPTLPTIRTRRASFSAASDASSSSDSSSHGIKTARAPNKALAAASASKTEQKKRGKSASKPGKGALFDNPTKVDDDCVSPRNSQDSYEEEILRARLANSKNAVLNDPILSNLKQISANSKRTQDWASHEVQVLKKVSLDKEDSAQPAVKHNLSSFPFGMNQSRSEDDLINQDDNGSNSDDNDSKDETGFLIILRHGSKEIEARCRPKETLQMILDRHVPDLAAKTIKLYGKTLDKSKQ